jgi:hypothetical protein
LVGGKINTPSGERTLEKYIMNERGKAEINKNVHENEPSDVFPEADTPPKLIYHLHYMGRGNFNSKGCSGT